VKVEHVKSRMTYDDWLKKYKGIDVHSITLEQHTKFSNEYQKWKVGNIEKVAGIWWKR